MSIHLSSLVPLPSSPIFCSLQFIPLTFIFSSLPYFSFPPSFPHPLPFSLLPLRFTLFSLSYLPPHFPLRFVFRLYPFFPPPLHCFRALTLSSIFLVHFTSSLCFPLPSPSSPSYDSIILSLSSPPSFCPALSLAHTHLIPFPPSSHNPFHPLYHFPSFFLNFLFISLPPSRSYRPPALWR